MGKMLIQSMDGYPVFTKVLDLSEAVPCRNICDQFVKGDPADFDSVYAFGKSVDVLTFEYEHVNVQALERLESEGFVVYPTANTMKIIQDRATQKQFYIKNNIPTAEFVVINSAGDLEKNLALIPGVLKVRRSGYDGKGVIKVDSLAETYKAFQGPSILEKKIDFEKEISVIVARNPAGESKVYPVVEMQANYEKNLLDFLFSPANISEKLKSESEELAEKISDRLGMVGVLAVEMFVTKDQKLLVNEIAPRPHNTGHHTIEANVTSQYEQHLRAVLGLPLGSTEAKTPAAMVNLVGPDGFSGKSKFEGLEEFLSKDGYYVHIYEKKETRPFRKMGHITILDQDINKAREKAKWIKEKVRIIV